MTPGRRQGYLDGMTPPRTAPPGASRLPALCCSFCTKDKDSVAKLIAGPGVYICNECVSLCDLILAQELAPELGSWNEHPDDEMLASLARTQAAVAQADAAVHDHVAVLRGRASAGPASGKRSGCRSRQHGSGSPERTDYCDRPP